MSLTPDKKSPRLTITAPSNSVNDYKDLYTPVSSGHEKNFQLKRVFSMENFEVLSIESANTAMSTNIEKLKQTIKDEKEAQKFVGDMQPFLKLFKRFNLEKKSRSDLEWTKINPPSPEQVINYNKMESCDLKKAKDLLSKLIVLKLNGGLGTTMGCVGPKSVIEVRGESTFLDLTVRQIEYINDKYGVDVPLVLMNSFNTHQETLKIINKYTEHNVKVETFNQKMFPRIDKDTLLPIPQTADQEKIEIDAWYPPGHGDVFDSFVHSPIFKKFKDEGKEYVFISNIDNLGATVDLSKLKNTKI